MHAEDILFLCHVTFTNFHHLMETFTNLTKCVPPAGSIHNFTKRLPPAGHIHKPSQLHKMCATCWKHSQNLHNFTKCVPSAGNIHKTFITSQNVCHVLETFTQVHLHSQLCWNIQKTLTYDFLLYYSLLLYVCSSMYVRSIHYPNHDFEIMAIVIFRLHEGLQPGIVGHTLYS